MSEQTKNLLGENYNPDVLECLANLSNDEVFTPPKVVNQMLDMFPSETWSNPNLKFLDPACKTGVFLREIAKRLIVGLEEQIDNNGKIIGVTSHKKHNFQPYNIETQVYPGFPKDLQAQIMIPLIMANGISIVNENLFENRMMHVAELCRMGANIEVENSKATIYGGTKLSGANVMATDLRASASLVIASLVADGITTIDRIYHLDRGYERIDEKLNQCGAKIKRVRG